MLFGSIFSGIGLFDLGLERAGMTVAWQIENDVACNRVLSRHWPDVKRFGDVSKVKTKKLRAVDVLCGGFPCQDLSVAGKRAGLAGKRSGLFFEFVRLARALAPRWILLENVPGLLSSANGIDMGVVIGSLVQLGYGVAWRVLDARYYGLAQRRSRVFIVGCLGDAGRAAQVLFERESCSWDLEASREARTEVAGSLGAGAKGSGWRDDFKRSGAFIPEIADPITRSFAKHHGASAGKDCFPRNHILARSLTTGSARRYDGDTETFVTHALRAEGADASEDGTGRGTPLVAFNWQNAGKVSYAMTEDGIGPLDRSQTKAVMGGFGVRRLTPLECERLQGAPDGWTEGESDSARYRCLGNAVAVPVVEWIGKRIMEHANVN